jgi:streptogramin lyase
MVATLVVVGCGGHAGGAQSAAVTEFPAGQSPTHIAAGPDGNLWFTELFRNDIGRMTPAGAVTMFSEGITPMPPGSMGGLLDVAAGPDGNVWFTEGLRDKVGRITPSGVVTEFTQGITPGSLTSGITSGPDGNVWFTENKVSQIGRITPSGVVTEFSKGITPGPQGTGLGDITTGPDGNLWFAEPGNQIGRITPTGVVTEFPLGIDQGSPGGVAAGSDGNVWFREEGSASGLGAGIGRITPSGVVTFFPAPVATLGGSGGIATGPDGNIWFIGKDYIGRITPSGVVTEFSAGIRPGSGLSDIAAGPDGNLWFTMQYDNRIGRLTPPGPEPPPATPQPPPGTVAGPAPAAPKLLSARASLRVAPVRGRFRVVALRASKLTPGSRVEVRCLRGCSLRKTFVARSRSKDLTALFRGRLLPAGTAISVRVTKAGTLGRYYRWTISGRGLVATRCQVSTRGKLVRCARA